MKKVISIILCAILVLGMAVNAIAATDPTVGFRPVPNNPAPGGTFNPAPNNPAPDGTFNPAPMNSAPKDNPGVKDILPEEDEIEDENPNTGAPVLEVIAVVTAAGCVSFVKKRK